MNESRVSGGGVRVRTGSMPLPAALLPRRLLPYADPPRPRRHPRWARWENGWWLSSRATAGCWFRWPSSRPALLRASRALAHRAARRLGASRVLAGCLGHDSLGRGQHGRGESRPGRGHPTGRRLRPRRH